MIEDLRYQQHWINCSRDDLIDRVKQQMKPKRFAHVLRVEETALKLAETYNADSEKVSIASLLHDYAKDMDEQDMYQLAYEFWPADNLKLGDTAIWHGPAAAQLARTQFDCQDESILQAVAWHTIGWHEMDLLAKVIFMADYIEPERDFPEVEEARRLTHKNLDQAVLFQLAESLRHLADERAFIFPDSVDIYNTWVTK